MTDLLRCYRSHLRFKSGAAYLRRYILETPWFSMLLHLWDSSDGPEPHDHPWPFVAVALWGSAEEDYRRYDPAQGNWICRLRKVRWLLPRWYRATDAHRIVRVSPHLVTLCVTGARKREWGFYLSPASSLWLPGDKPQEQMTWKPHTEVER